MHDQAHSQWTPHIYVAVEHPRCWALSASLLAISVAGAPVLTSLQRVSLLSILKFMITSRGIL